MALKVKLVKSTIGCKKNQIATVAALGLKKIGQEVVKEDNPCIQGMVFTVKHLVTVEQV